MKHKLQNTVIRDYREADRESCRGLWRELVERHRELYSDPTIGGDCPEDYFDRHLAKDHSIKVWVADIDSVVVGFASLMVNRDEAKLDPIVVSKPFREKGVGKQLVERVINEAKQMSVKYLNVEPVVRNVEAIRFYHDLGFINIGQVQLFLDFSNKKWNQNLYLAERRFNL